ncbi:MAG: hypothetical protein U1F52_22110 [Burkholderiales bacterium]
MHPFAALPPSTRLPALGVLLVLTLALAWFLGDQGKPLKVGPAVPDGLLSAEFAWTAARWHAIAVAWGPDLQALARRLLTLDFVFALAYPLLLAMGCALVAEIRDAPQAAFGIFLSWAMLAAIPLEFMENAAMLQWLNRGPPARTGDALVRFVGVCAGLKFTLAFAALGYVLLAQLGLIAARLGSER